MKCMKKVSCRECPSHATCPRGMRRDKRVRRTKADTASLALIGRAAEILATGWFTCRELGTRLFGEPKPGKSGLMSLMVRARRPINRLRSMGALAVRPNQDGSAAYTLPEWPEGVPR